MNANSVFKCFCVQEQKTHPTKRAADGGESVRFTGSFLALSFCYISSHHHAHPCPPLTQTVGRLPIDGN